MPIGTGIRTAAGDAPQEVFQPNEMSEEEVEALQAVPPKCEYIEFRSDHNPMPPAKRLEPMVRVKTEDGMVFQPRGKDLRIPKLSFEAMPKVGQDRATHRYRVYREIVDAATGKSRPNPDFEETVRHLMSLRDYSGRGATRFGIWRADVANRIMFRQEQGTPMRRRAIFTLAGEKGVDPAKLAEDLDVNEVSVQQIEEQTQEVIERKSKILKVLDKMQVTASGNDPLAGLENKLKAAQAAKKKDDKEKGGQ